MKNIKKLLSILMVLTLVLALGANAFAATVTIDEQLEGHTFTAYQIFTGTQNDESGNALGSVAWGEDIDAAAFVTALQGIDPVKFADCKADDPQSVVEALSGADADLAKKVADAAATCITGEGVSFTESTTLDNGYYLIKDTTETIDGADAYNDVVLQVTEDVTIDYKTDVPTSDKFVKDKNDTKNEETEWQKTADYDIGDDVPFQLKGTLPKNYADYTTYYLAFHDKQEKGLTFDSDSVKVYVDGNLIESGYEVKTSELDDDCTFEVVFADMKLVTSAKAESVITVEYTAKLNDDAVIGNPGNHNTSTMEFSNDSHSDSHGNTPEKKVVVFTYDLDVNKVDGKGEPLEGAEFKLYKKVPVGTKDAVALDKDGKVAAEGDAIWLPVTLEGKVIGEGPASKTTFYAKGLDDGEYKLVETKVPDGYNGIDPIDFTVSAEHSDTLTKLEGAEDFAIELTPVEDGEAIMDTNITNNSGLELPETGGIGTTIFYVVGGILVVAAVILLVTRRRVSGSEK